MKVIMKEHTCKILSWPEQAVYVSLVHSTVEICSIVSSLLTGSLPCMLSDYTCWVFCNPVTILCKHDFMTWFQSVHLSSLQEYEQMLEQQRKVCQDTTLYNRLCVPIVWGLLHSAFFYSLEVRVKDGRAESIAPTEKSETPNSGGGYNWWDHWPPLCVCLCVQEYETELNVLQRQKRVRNQRICHASQSISCFHFNVTKFATRYQTASVYAIYHMVGIALGVHS